MISVVLHEHAFKLQKTLTERNLPSQVNGSLPTEGAICGVCEGERVTRVNLGEIPVKQVFGRITITHRGVLVEWLLQRLKCYRHQNIDTSYYDRARSSAGKDRYGYLYL